MTDRATLTSAVKSTAAEAGFARAGVARAGRLNDESRYLDAWLAAGRQGQMSWMEDTAEVRKDPRNPKMLDSAKSVVVMAAPYAQRGVFRGPPPAEVAKYALGRDYHNVLSKRARRVARLLQSEGHRARVAVDSKPVFERAWAERAGIGFVGKNCCLIVPGIGSHVLLACVVTTAELEPDTPMGRRCGSCTRCLDACPTRAFVEPRVLDARRCISYLTIEHHGPIPEEHRSAMGAWLFGCDVCQDVCPYNASKDATQHTLEAFEPGARWADREAVDFLTMNDDAFADWATGSPLKRAGSEGLARNASIVLGNRGKPVHLPVLKEASQRHRSPTVREAAAWGVKALTHRLADER